MTLSRRLARIEAAVRTHPRIEWRRRLEQVVLPESGDRITFLKSELTRLGDIGDGVSEEDTRAALLPLLRQLTDDELRELAEETR